jgi:hypothetical protein
MSGATAPVVVVSAGDLYLLTDLSHDATVVLPMSSIAGDLSTIVVNVQSSNGTRVIEELANYRLAGKRPAGFDIQIGRSALRMVPVFGDAPEPRE